MTFQTAPPPGWYYAAGDPPGTQRWWDGVSWVGGPNIARGWSGVPVPGGAGPYGYAIGQRTGPVFAGFWQRVGASLLDGLILGAPGSIVMGVLFAIAPTERRPCFDDIDGRQQLCEVPTIGSVLGIMGLYFALMLLAVILYYGLLEGKTGQTIGKRALGIKTVRRTTGEMPGVGRAIGRTFADYLSGAVCYLGYLWMLWDPDKQTWHDKICDTIVIQT